VFQDFDQPLCTNGNIVPGQDGVCFGGGLAGHGVSVQLQLLAFTVAEEAGLSKEPWELLQCNL